MLNSIRLNWFLGLQRTLRFPRYSLAPFPNLRRFHGIDVEYLETAPSAAPEARNTATVPQRPAVAHSDAIVAIFASKPNIAAQDYLPGHRSVSPRLWSANGRSPPRAADRAHVLYRTQAGRPQNDPVTSRSLKRVGSPVGRLPWLPPPFDTSKRTSTAQTRLALVDSSSEIRAQMAPTAETAANQSIRRGYSRIGQLVPPAVVNAHSTFNDGFSEQPVSEAPDLDAPAQGAQQPKQPPSASTLHIDGAALGRWTVQHLARTLGKPTTGMTGVDPRAVMPRSRIQPF